MLQEFSDTELIRKVLDGDASAYAGLVRRHQRFVFTLALRFSKSREDAEEIAQDCFVKAYRSLHTFRQTSKFSTWLYSIVYTTSMTFLRKNTLPTQSIDEPSGQIITDHLVSGNVLTDVESKCRRRFIDQAIRQLPETDAAIISLFYLGEQSLEEIGAVLNLDTNNVKVKLHRARQRLKEKIGNILQHEVKELL